MRNDCRKNSKAEASPLVDEGERGTRKWAQWINNALDLMLNSELFSKSNSILHANGNGLISSLRATYLSSVVRRMPARFRIDSDAREAYFRSRRCQAKRQNDVFCRRPRILFDTSSYLIVDERIPHDIRSKLNSDFSILTVYVDRWAVVRTSPIDGINYDKII